MAQVTPRSEWRAYHLSMQLSTRGAASGAPAAGVVLASQTPMDWRSHDPDKTAKIAAQIADLIPADILRDSDRLELASCAHTRRYSRDEVIYHFGDPAADVFLIQDGSVKVLLENEAGREAIVGLLGRGEFFGELVLFESAPRESTVIAIAPTTVLQIPANCFLLVIEGHPSARNHMLRRLAATIHHFSGILETHLFLDVPSRLAKYLLELSGPDQPALTQDELAAVVGSTRVTVNKALADLQRRGLISVDRRRVRVLDAARLRKEIRL